MARRLDPGPSGGVERLVGRGPVIALHPRVVGRRFEWRQRQPAQAGVPDALGRDLGDEHEGGRSHTADGCRIDRRATTSSRTKSRLIRRPKFTLRAEPAGVDLAAPDEAAVLDVEDVGEVGFDLDIDRQSDRPRAVVDEVVVLVDTTRHGRSRRIDRLWRDAPSRSSSSGFVYSKRDEKNCTGDELSRTGR